MRIKQLEVVGFKSFAQKTVLNFPSGITAIVGPNGCGKSNVVDAIRWVLGEQSPKHLRGESMEDVIFKGNDRTAPSGMAQVSLTFENDPTHVRPADVDLDVSTLPDHFRNLSEIQVTRRLFRSGESDYQINKTPCRLKDITELFLGTGIGSKAYAIIEQGRVDQLIHSKPEDRRLFIEEAAGTTLYRSRKIAAERKMERTRENLMRVNDILRELERQIQYLHRLAKKAEQYKTLQAEIRQLDFTLSRLHWQRLTGALVEIESGLAASRAREQELVEALAQLETQRSAKIADQMKAEEELGHWRETAAVLETECQSLQQRIELLTREAGERERRGARLQAEATTLAHQDAQVREAIEIQERERGECVGRLGSDETELHAKASALETERVAVRSASAAVEAAKNSVVSLATRESECRNAIATHTRRLEETQRRLEKLDAEYAEASQRLSTLDSILAARRDDVEQLRARLRTAEDEKKQRAERVRALSEERRQREADADQAQQSLLQLRSRLASLQELQRNYEGYQRGVRSILREANAETGVMGVVADVLDVPEPYERAVAAALGERLQYVIVRDGDDGVGAVRALRSDDSGRGSFIPLAPRKIDLPGAGAASLNGNTRRLIDLVNVDEPYRHVAESLLGEVVLVPDLPAGLALWRKNGVHVTLVTPEGDTIDATGVITGGSEHPIEEEIVSRRRVVGEISSLANAAETSLVAAEAELERLGRELEVEETALRNLDRDVHALTLDLVAGEKDLERLEGERPRWLDRLDVIRFESEALKNEQTEASSGLDQAQRNLAEATEWRATEEATLRQRQQEAAVAAACVETLTAEVTAIKVRVAEGRQRHEAAMKALARLQQQLGEMSERAAALATEHESTEAEGMQLRGDADAAVRRREALVAERADVETQIGSARAGLDAASQAVAEQEQRLHDTRAELDAARVQCNQHEVAGAEKRLRIEHLVGALQEKYEIGVAELPAVEELPAEHEQEMQARLDSLRQKISRIGEVNVGAIDELKELEERAQFLRTQKDDLERSLDDLEKTIQRLNRASRTKFAEAFAAVNEKFQQTLPQLFRGCEGRLVLTDEHNLLESGVEIVVRPPGKKLETVALLSGGEKALVAVSLIFSLFLINPTPFCFLDEVDAPLDDTNVGRFTDIVRSMSAHSQFITITHNKRTMQAADVLYGVTMQEPGISKIISVSMH